MEMSVINFSSFLISLWHIPRSKILTYLILFVPSGTWVPQLQRATKPYFVKWPLPNSTWFFPLQLYHSRASPGVLGSPSLSLPLWVPLQCPLDYMSIWSHERVANLGLSSFSYPLLCCSLPRLPPKLLVADSSRPPNPQDVLRVLSDEHLQLLLQSLSQPPSARTIPEHRVHILPKDSQLGLGC